MPSAVSGITIVDDRIWTGNIVSLAAPILFVIAPSILPVCHTGPAVVRLVSFTAFVVLRATPFLLVSTPIILAATAVKLLGSVAVRTTTIEVAAELLLLL